METLQILWQEDSAKEKLRNTKIIRQVRKWQRETYATQFARCTGDDGVKVQVSLNVQVPQWGQQGDEKVVMTPQLQGTQQQELATVRHPRWTVTSAHMHAQTHTQAQPYTHIDYHEDSMLLLYVCTKKEDKYMYGIKFLVILVCGHCWTISFVTVQETLHEMVKFLVSCNIFSC